MLNREIHLKPPEQNRLVNNGVAEVSEDYSDSALQVFGLPGRVRPAASRIGGSSGFHVVYYFFKKQCVTRFSGNFSITPGTLEINKLH
jgi:hypothetical protein